MRREKKVAGVTFVFRTSWFDDFSELNAEEFMSVLRCLAAYVKDMSDENREKATDSLCDRVLRLAFLQMAALIENDKSHYNMICRNRSEAASLRELSKRSTKSTIVQKDAKTAQKAQLCSPPTDDDKEEDKAGTTRRPPFIPPTIEEVRAFIAEKGYHFSAESFWYFYDSKGWMVGKNKMQRWRSACATFEHHRDGQRSPSGYDTGVIMRDKVDYDDMEESWNNRT